MQECVVACTFNAPEMWDLNKVEFTRFAKGINIGTQGVRIKAVWECQDGYVILVAQGGVQPFVGSMKELTNWMAGEGMADEWLQQLDWAKDYDASKLTQQTVDRVEKAISQFFMTKTKKELYEDGALKKRIMIGPMFTSKDISVDKQLQSRDFWVNVEHPEVNETIIYPGPFLKLNNNPIQYQRRAPLIGEHNSEIYKELGLSSIELSILKQAGVI
jgi:crotonobetainyl-CoA:carnitine CoA-transferase CaiB-like acyl-CoA transferase